MQPKINKELSIVVDWNDYRGQPLREAIYLIIRGAVLNGQLESGQRFSEEKMAEALGVSRTPVREAMRRLENEGYVCVYVGRYVEVAGVELQELLEEYALREVIEGFAARMAAKHCTEEDTGRMSFHLDRMETAVTQADFAAIVAANSDFHDALVASTRNQKLKDVISLLWRSMLLHSAKSLTNVNWAKQALKEHRELLAALVAHNSDKAEDIGKKHVRHAQNNLTKLKSPS